MNPLDDKSPPKVPFIKEDFAALIQETEFLDRYGRSWRAVFLSLVVLIAIGLISWLICVNTEPDPGTWPWWIYPLAFLLVALGLLYGGSLCFHLYKGVRYMPGAIKTKRSMGLRVGKRDRASADALRKVFQEKSRAIAAAAAEGQAERSGGSTVNIYGWMPKIRRAVMLGGAAIALWFFNYAAPQFFNWPLFVLLFGTGIASHGR